ncbi:MAG: hypothetical protein ABIF87_16470, partial [Pseudomonadota bacterium]
PMIKRVMILANSSRDRPSFRLPKMYIWFINIISFSFLLPYGTIIGGTENAVSGQKMPFLDGH